MRFGWWDELDELCVLDEMGALGGGGRVGRPWAAAPPPPPPTSYPPPTPHTNRLKLASGPGPELEPGLGPGPGAGPVPGVGPGPGPGQGPGPRQGPGLGPGRGRGPCVPTAGKVNKNTFLVENSGCTHASGLVG